MSEQKPDAPPPERSTLPNVLLVAGAAAIIVGIAMFKLGAGVIALGVFLVLGALDSTAGKSQAAQLGKLKKSLNQ